MRDGWVVATLGEIATTVAPSKNGAGSMPYLGLEHFDSGSPRLSRWADTDDFTSQTTPFESGDTLFSKLRPYLRKVAVPHFPGRCTTEALVYRPSAGSGLSQSFLALVMQTDATIGHAVATSAGSRMPRTSARLMASMPVLLPPLDDQRRIVDLIGALDDTIAAAERARTSARRSLTAVLTTSIGADGTASVKSVIRYMIGGTWGTPPGEGERDVVALGPRSYADGRTAVDTSTGTPRSLSASRAETRLTQPGDIILERSGGTQTQPVGRVIRALRESARVIPSDFQRLLRPDREAIDPGYLFWFLWANYEAGNTVPFQKATTNIRNLNITDYLTHTRIPVPSRADQERIAGFGDQMYLVIKRHEGSTSMLKILRSNLLTALLSGEHEVPSSYDELMGRA